MTAPCFDFHFHLGLLVSATPLPLYDTHTAALLIAHEMNDQSGGGVTPFIPTLLLQT
jgi:hypothetical protein